jgi:hypothetical protein
MIVTVIADLIPLTSTADSLSHSELMDHVGFVVKMLVYR